MAETLRILITYTLSSDQIDRIRKVSPRLDVRYAPEVSDAEQYFSSAEVLFGDIDRDQFIKMPNLRWIQISTVGAEKFLFPELMQSPVVLCCAKGMHKFQMTELLFGMMLGVSRKLFSYYDLQKNKEWTTSLIRQSNVLTGKTLGVIGVGSIGTQMAKVAKSFGMYVIGTKRTPVNIEWVDEMLPPSGLNTLLSRADHIVLVAPLTTDTQKMIGEKEFDLMKPTAVFYNLGRGASVDEMALIQAMEARKISAAILDVFDEEPLRKESPLWTLPNVFITPHIGGPIPHYKSLLIEIFIDNMKRFLEGKDYATAIDKRKGY
jgi:phosphoglycerate dehydrogenase-like enzyme